MLEIIFWVMFAVWAILFAWLIVETVKSERKRKVLIEELYEQFGDYDRRFGGQIVRPEELPTLRKHERRGYERGFNNEQSDSDVH